MPNKGGFSWKRVLGVTRAKQQFARKTGIPLTKSGRQRKIGKALTGGSCLLPIIFLVLLVFGTAVSAVTAQPSYDIYLPLVMKVESTPTPIETFDYVIPPDFTSCYELVEQFSTTLQLFYQVNGLTDCVVRIGQTVKIPLPGA